MNDVLRQNVAMVEDSAAAAYALQTETQGLTTMVRRFEIGDAGNREPRGTAAAQARLNSTMDKLSRRAAVSGMASLAR